MYNLILDLMVITKNVILLDGDCDSFFEELIVQEDAVISYFIGGAILFHVKQIGYEATEDVCAVGF
ncbi:MAG: hypothetical protein A2447_09270 [Omnitrophica WOR_2 bacterium RIFOXYC2_FULL_38_12]|nr:MAG: hypothetical protein A2447_09270 [Omnitrophica WOR_2 bacterium RIFOXYC2_FULL_38_12]